MNMEENIRNFANKAGRFVADVESKAKEMHFFSKYRESDDLIGDVLDDAGKSATETAAKIGNWAMPKIQTARKAFFDEIRKKYDTAGAPYGDNQDGFERWMNEQKESLKDKTLSTLSDAKESTLKGVRKVARKVDDALFKKENPSRDTVDSTHWEDL